jgi:hypothetical protein
MPMFIVTVEERRRFEIAVDADDEANACDEVHRGRGDFVRGDLSQQIVDVSQADGLTRPRQKRKQLRRLLPHAW